MLIRYDIRNVVLHRALTSNIFFMMDERKTAENMSSISDKLLYMCDTVRERSNANRSIIWHFGNCFINMFLAISTCYFFLSCALV